MKQVLAFLLFEWVVSRASAMLCSISDLVAPSVVADSFGAEQLAAAVNCSGGYFTVQWAGVVNILGVIEIGTNTTLNVHGTEDGTSYADGSGQTPLFRTYGGTLNAKDLILANGNASYPAYFEGEHGGAIAAFNDASVTIANCTFIGNIASKGGAIWTENSTVHLLGKTYLCFNVGRHSGGGIQIRDSDMYIKGNVTFRGNEAGESGGGIMMSNYSYLEVSGSVLFRENRASTGGALELNEKSHFNVTTGGTVSLLSNNATGDGGGISSKSNSCLNFESKSTALFFKNTAKRAGAMWTSTSTVHLLGITYFYNNVVRTSGGAIEIQYSDMYIEGNATFRENEAGYNGGGIVEYGSSFLEVSGRVLFEENRALSGGALVLNIHSQFNTTTGGTVEFRSNNATGDGGGIICMSNSSVNFDKKSTAFFFNNTANRAGVMWTSTSAVHLLGMTYFSFNAARASGGAIEIQYSDMYIEGNATFRGNEAGYNGGGIVTYGSSSLEVSGSVLFEKNRASSGGALVISMNSYFHLTANGKVEFHSNTATVNGGAIFSWKYSGVEFEDKSTALFMRNNAEYGGALSIATSVAHKIAGNVQMVLNKAKSSGGAVYIDGSEYVLLKTARLVSNFAYENGGAISMISPGSEPYSASAITDCYFEDNKANDLGGAVYTIGGYVNISNSSFIMNTAGQTGGAIRTSSLTVLENCDFDGNTAYIGSAVSTAVPIETTLEGIKFKNNSLLCGDGLFLDWSNESVYDTVCESCGDCSNCPRYNASTVQLCKPIPDNTVSRLPNGTLESLELDKGYWRNSKYSYDIRQCYETTACVGGSDNYCQAGYSGPFCAVCADGYAQGLRYTCFECSERRRSAAIAIAVVVVPSILALFCCGVNYAGPTNDPLNHRWPNGFTELQSRVRAVKASQTLKIVIVSWQILTQFSGVASVAFRRLYDRFLSVIDVCNLNLSWILAAGCFIDTNFYTNLLVATIGPLAIAGVILMSYCFTCLSYCDSDRNTYARCTQRHASILFWVSFLVYASTSSTVFRTFACDYIDIEKSYLRADHSLQCNTTEHQVFKAYAGVMILVHPVGIPLCYALVLYYFHTTLRTEPGRGVNSRPSVVKDLWKAYRPEVYYYEVIECLRRVILSGVVVLVFPDSAGQVAITFLLALFFFTVMIVLNPYANRRDFWLAILGHAVVIMSMFVALLLKVDISSDDIFSQDVFAGVLIFGNCAMILVFIAEAFGMCFVTVRELRCPN